MIIQKRSLEAEYILKFINQTQKNIFLTGKAGTGKTTLLKEIVNITHKKVLILASTGIAALNAGGTTIHSMFQFPLKPFIPEENNNAFSSSLLHKFETIQSIKNIYNLQIEKIKVLRQVDLIIIDEVSMLRPDIVDAIHYKLQSIRHSTSAFGGVQILFIGDLFQLPPIIKNEEWEILKNYYSNKFFFDAHVLKEVPPLYIELEKIFRQEDHTFISLLNNLRNGELTNQNIKTLNQQFQPNFDIKNHKGYVTITTHNSIANRINKEALQAIDSPIYSFTANIEGNFPENIFPLPETLELKKNAQVMFIKNDFKPEKKYYNGKIGIITDIEEDYIIVSFHEENISIEVQKYKWKNIEYFLNKDTKEIDEEVVGSFEQYPLKLAWAITVHKSQGLTFNKAALDIKNVFEAGQSYVALSRLTNLKGLVLLSLFPKIIHKQNTDIINYTEKKLDIIILKDIFEKESKHYLKKFLLEAFSLISLIKAWKYHIKTYKEGDEKSFKLKSKNWAKQNTNLLLKEEKVFIGFHEQLEKIFSATPIKLDFLQNRIFSATDYFISKLKPITINVLVKIEETKKQKKVKKFMKELENLETLHITKILSIFKAKEFIKNIMNKKTITKQNLRSTEAEIFINTIKESVQINLSQLPNLQPEE